jgi:hypothetical protein
MTNPNLEWEIEHPLEDDTTFREKLSELLYLRVFASVGPAVSYTPLEDLLDELVEELQPLP